MSDMMPDMFDHRIAEADPAVITRIIASVEASADELVDAIRSIVRIPSVRGEAAADAPFGREVRRALDEALARARSLGFRTVDVDGYAGYAVLPASESAKPGYVCAIGHLDVVSAGTGWRHPAFSGHLENGRIVSRGVLDNKGPIFACLYALHALKLLDLAPAREVRVIFGCDEESGFNDLRHYLSVEPAPVMGFTPDCKYPVVYAERGRLTVRVRPRLDADASPERSTRAIFAFMNEFLLNAGSDGRRLGIDIHDEEFGMTQVRNIRLQLSDGIPEAQFAVSYPASVSADELMERIGRAIAPADLSARSAGNFDPVRFERDCPLVQALVFAYELITGQDGSPVTTTGGTYAKLMPHIVPFGPSFPGQRGIGHEPDEWMSVDDIIANAKIYAVALYLLSR